MNPRFTIASVASRAEALAVLTGLGQPYEMASTAIAGLKQRVFVNAPRSLRQLYEEAVSDNPFIVYREERLTFAEAWAEASRIAQLLERDFGVAKGDRVAISMRNYPEWILAFMATTSLGAIAVAFNAHWQADELRYGLEDSGAKVLFVDQERLGRLTQGGLAGELKVISVRSAAGRSVPSLPDLLATVPVACLPVVDIDPDDPATISYTSGSTGYPKGVVSSHRNILTALLSLELDAKISALLAGPEPAVAEKGSAALLAVPLFHVTGSHGVLLRSFRSQRKVVSMYKWDPYVALELIEREKITWFTAPAAMTGDLVRVARDTKRDLTSLALVGGGGAPRAPEQVRKLKDVFPRAIPNTGWGMTETNVIGTGIGGQDYLDHPGSCGRCTAAIELKIVDEARKALAAGGRGELLVRGASVFRGYWNRPEVNAEAFLDDGWFRTGDVAWLDDEGFVFIVDRIKDLIIRGGENIGCGQVEAALLMHPDVLEAAVYGVPDDRLGEEVGATIYGASSLTPEGLQAFLADHLAKFEIPQHFRFVTRPLPRTASGKILKKDLRDQAVKAPLARARA